MLVVAVGEVKSRKPDGNVATSPVTRLDISSVCAHMKTSRIFSITQHTPKSINIHYAILLAIDHVNLGLALVPKH